MATVQHYERVFKKKRVGMKIAMIGLYLFIASLWFVISVLFYFHYTFVLLAPLSILIVFLLTWKYTNLEYEYAFEAGTFSFSKIYGGSRRHTVFEMEIKSIDEVIPYNARNANRLKKAKLIDAIIGKNAENPCYCVYKDQNEKTVCLLFDCDEQSAKIFKFFAPAMTDRAIFEKIKNTDTAEEQNNA